MLYLYPDFWIFTVLLFMGSFLLGNTVPPKITLRWLIVSTRLFFLAAACIATRRLPLTSPLESGQGLQMSATEQIEEKAKRLVSLNTELATMDRVVQQLEKENSRLKGKLTAAKINFEPEWDGFGPKAAPLPKGGAYDIPAGSAPAQPKGLT